MKFNVRETIRFVLRNAFKEQDPELTQTLTELYTQCPTLYDQVLSRQDRSTLSDELKLDELSVEVEQSADAQHRHPSAINAIPYVQIRVGQHALNGGQRLPTYASDGETVFRQLIRLAYEKDYGKPRQYPALFQKDRRIQWSRKFSFTSKYVFSLHVTLMIGLSGPLGTALLEALVGLQTIECTGSLECWLEAAITAGKS